MSDEKHAGFRKSTAHPSLDGCGSTCVECDIDGFLKRLNHLPPKRVEETRRKLLRALGVPGHFIAEWLEDARR